MQRPHRSFRKQKLLNETQKFRNTEAVETQKLLKHRACGKRDASEGSVFAVIIFLHRITRNGLPEDSSFCESLRTCMRDG